MKRYQRGEAGVAMVAIMLIAVLGFSWWGGMHGGGHMGESQRAQQSEKTPLELLDEAYARGDITRDEYLQRREDLLKR